jgi:PadR family transcriptional regulator, regulatory protein PadR
VVPPLLLGAFEQLIILAILGQGPEASGVGIARALERTTRRAVSRGALYTTLNRLEAKGCVRWRLRPAKGDWRRPRRIYSITSRGLAAIRAARRDWACLARGLEHVLDALPM